jgi:hypothetical protein
MDFFMAPLPGCFARKLRLGMLALTTMFVNGLNLRRAKSICGASSKKRKTG